MAGRAKKSTKKFEKNHLKDTIEKRKEFAKIKQRQQIKAKKQARNASDYAKVSDDEESKPAPKAGAKAKGQTQDFSKMSVDEFFQGGFQLPEQKKKPKLVGKAKDVPQKIGKRKREATQAGRDEDSGMSSSDEVVDAFSDEEPGSDVDGPETHKEDLDALKEKDPEFYKYLKENDAELLDFAEDDLAEVNQLSEEEAPKKKRKKSKEIGEKQEEQEAVTESDVTMAMVNKWKIALSEQHSLRATRQVVLAFRAAAYVNDEGGKEHKYSIASPEVYHQLLVVALEHVPGVLSHHLPAKESNSGKVRISTDSKKFRTLSPLLKSHAASIQHLLENLSDAPTIKLTLSSLLPLLPYLLSFKKVLKSLVKTTVNIWSDPASTEATRITAFLLLRRLAVISDASLREAVLKTTYQGLVKGSRTTNIHTISGINLMKNSAAELWGLDPNIGYTTGFTYIRQLAVHLRTSITHPTKDSYKTIYNWQYTHSLDFWSRVLSSHCTIPSSPLHPLIYPLVQITLGALRLIPTPTYFPLRFHLTRSLLRLSLATSTYIPLAPSLLEVLNSPDLTKPPKPSTLKPLDFNTALRAPKSYLRTRVYQDALGAQITELLGEFFAIWAKHIAFPELALPPTVLLKRWLKSATSAPSRSNPKSTATNSKGKGNKNSKLNSYLSLLVGKLESNARYIESHRRNVTFGPSDRAGVEGFLRDTNTEETPLGAFVAGERRRREERERVVAEGRVREEGRGKGREEREAEVDDGVGKGEWEGEIEMEE